MLLRTDIRSSGKMLQRNIKTIRSWVEEAQESASKCALSAPRVETSCSVSASATHHRRSAKVCMSHALLL